MRDAAVEAHHVQLHRVVVARNGLVHGEDHIKGQVTVCVDGAPRDDRALEQGFVVGFDDDVHHASKGEVQAVVRVDRATDRKVAVDQFLLAVVKLDGEFGDLRDGERDLVGTNGIARRPGNDHGVITDRQVVRKGQRQHGHEGRRATGKVQFTGDAEAFWNHHGEAHVCPKAVHGLDKDGCGNDPRNATRHHDPWIHRRDGEIRVVVNGERHRHGAFSTVLGAGDGQGVLAAAHVHGVHDDRSKLIESEGRGAEGHGCVVRVDRRAEVDVGVEFVESNGRDPCCEGQTHACDIIDHAREEGEVGRGPVVVALTPGEGLDAVGGERG